MKVTRDKGIENLKEAIVCYLEGLWIASANREMDVRDSIVWLERPVHRLVIEMRTEIEIFFDLIDRIIGVRHDVDERGIGVVMDYLSRSPAPVDDMLKARVKGLCVRTARKIERSHKDFRTMPGMLFLHASMEKLADRL